MGSTIKALFRGKMLGFMFLLYLISLIGMYVNVTAYGGDGNVMFIPLAAPGCMTVIFLLGLLKRSADSIYDLLPEVQKGLYIVSLPLIFVNAVTNVILYGFLERKWMGKEIFLHLTISYGIALVVGTVVFLVVLLPVFSVRAPKMVTEGTELEGKPLRKWTVLSGIIAFNCVLWIGPVMSAFSLGFDAQMLLHPSEVWLNVKVVLRSLSYGEFYVEEVIWLVGIFLTYGGMFYLVFLFLSSFILEKLQRPIVFTKKWYLGQVATILLIGLVFVLTIFISEGKLGGRAELHTALVYEDGYEAKAELDASKDLLDFLDRVMVMDTGQEEPIRDFQLRKLVKDDRDDVYSLYISGLQLAGVEKEVNMNVSTDMETFHYEVERERYDEKLETTDGNIIYIENRDGYKYMRYAADDFYFNFSIYDDSNQVVQDETILYAVDLITDDSQFIEQISESAKAIIEDAFILPSYFPNNIEFNDLIIYPNKLVFGYYKGYEGDDVGSSISYEVSPGSREIYRDKKPKDIHLADDRPASLYYATDRPVTSGRRKHNNELIFEKGGYTFDFLVTNGESPLHDRQTTHLLKMANSLLVQVE